MVPFCGVDRESEEKDGDGTFSEEWRSMASKGISKKATHSQQQQAQAQEHQQIALGMVQPSSSLSGSFM